jgi:hypothetical protein
MLNAVYPIVEGHGDAKAVPILLRRFAQEQFYNHQITIFAGHRIAKGRMLSTTDRSLENAVEFGARKLATVDGPGAILILLDADSDCPAQIGVDLLRRARTARNDVFSSVVVAKAEYEAWLVASAHALRGKCNVRATANPPPNPEEIVDAKGYIERNLLEPGRYYSEVVDQPRMTAQFDFREAAMCPSFRKLQRDLTVAFAL